MEWFKIGKGVRQGSILSPCLFNLYAEYIMQNARLDEAQAGIKIAGRNINNLRYADDTTLIAESEEELRSLLMKVKKENEKDGLKLSIKKNHGNWSHHFMVNTREKSGNSDRFCFLRLQYCCRLWLQPWNSKTPAPWKENYDKPTQCINKQRHHFVDKVPYSQSCDFSSSHVQCESWIIKKVERWRIDTFELWFWRKTWKSLGLQGDQTSWS